MITAADKNIYFPRTFNEQMAWIGEEVEHIIKYNLKADIQEQGIEVYGKNGVTHAINRLFEIVKADPKNKALLREIRKSEEEFKAFLYDQPSSLLESEIYEYWNNYLWAYVAELEYSPCLYFIMVGYDNNYDGAEWLGVYQSLSKTKEVYNQALEQLQEEHKELEENPGRNNLFTIKHEKVMIHIFNENDNQWTYDTEPSKLFNEFLKTGKEAE